MFKKRCSRCDRKIGRDFDFCPYCGFSFSKKGDYGLLGKNDDLNELDKIFDNSLSGFSLGGKMPGLGGSFMEKMLAGAMKALDKEMRNLDGAEEEITKMPEQNPNIRTGFQLFINGKQINLPNNVAGISIEDKRLGQNNSNRSNNIKQRREIPGISEETLKNSTKLPRKEAKSKISRLKDRVLYELETPGLNMIENVLINKLESALEIKAYTDKAVFYKTLPIKLQLLQYSIKPEGKLVLEFKA